MPAAIQLTNMQKPVFGAHALAMLDLRLAVIPIGPGRKPYVSGFQRWRKRPGVTAISRWVEGHPQANIGVLPGLCGRGALVADCDTLEHAEAFQNLFGQSELRIRTNRGLHLWYRKESERLPGNLRKYGLDVDFKTGTQIAIAPPSIHESGHIYRLENCDWSALQCLRPIDIDALREYTGKSSSSEKWPLNTVPRDGSRGLSLNDHLVKRAWRFSTFDDMLADAHDFNAATLDPRGPIGDDELSQRAGAVWRDLQTGKIEKWEGADSMNKRHRFEIRRLCELDAKHGPDAYAMLLVLRDEHSARCRRDETFALSPEAMAGAGVMFGWTKERYRFSRDLLWRAGFVECVSKFVNSANGRSAAQFKLAKVSSGARGGGQ